jgi:hypothetical protein
MENIFLITSIINIPNIPLSYTKIRSIYSCEERFKQTQQTIKSIRKSIKGIKIFLIECSELSNEQTLYLKTHTDFFINVFNKEDNVLLNMVYSPSKSLGEGTMTIIALNFLLSNKIEYDNIFKISGRYWLNDTFNLSDYDNNKIVVRNNSKPYEYYTQLYTILYKLDKETVSLWLHHLRNSYNFFIECVAFEKIFADFIKSQPTDKVVYITNLGVSGNIAVDGCFIND